MDNLSARDLRSIRRERDALERERLRLRQELSQQRDRYLQQQRDRRVVRDIYPVRIGPTQIIQSDDYQFTDESSAIDATTGEVTDATKDDKHKDEKDKGNYFDGPLNRSIGDSFMTLDQTHGSMAEHEGQDEKEARSSRDKTDYETGARPKFSVRDQRSLDIQELDLYRRMNALRIQSNSAKKELETGFRQQEQIMRRRIFPSDIEEFTEDYSYTPRHDYEQDKALKASSTKDVRRQKGELGTVERDHYSRIESSLRRYAVTT